MIDNVFLYHEKNPFVDLYEIECTESCYSKNLFMPKHTTDDSQTFLEEWVSNKL